MRTAVGSQFCLGQGYKKVNWRGGFFVGFPTVNVA